MIKNSWNNPDIQEIRDNLDWYYEILEEHSTL